jgi:hypothetical protein
VQLADRYQLPHSHVSDWEQADLDDAIGLQAYRGECCSECGTHPSTWKPELGGDMNAVVPVWRHCRVCELTARAQKAGPPHPDLPGWHLVLQRNPNVPRRS